MLSQTLCGTIPARLQFPTLGFLLGLFLPPCPQLTIEGVRAQATGQRQEACGFTTISKIVAFFWFLVATQGIICQEFLGGWHGLFDCI
jgi:hypothetical protein